MPPPGGRISSSAIGWSDFPALGLSSQRTDGRFLVLERTDENQTLDKVSPFLIDKVIKNCCGSEVTSVKRIRDGKILIQTRTARQATQLKTLKSLADNINVKVVEHTTLNTCKVVVSCRDFFELSDEVILEEMKEQKVLKVDRMKRRVNGKLEDTASVILTLDTIIRPKSVKVGFMTVEARPYYPRPMRCVMCLRYGHPARECRAEKACANCGEIFHGDDVRCPNPPKCINCKEDHATISPKCPIWIKENAIVHLRVDKDIPMNEARKIVEQEASSGPTYASKAAIGSNGCSCRCMCGSSNQGPAQLPEKASSSQIPNEQVIVSEIQRQRPYSQGQLLEVIDSPSGTLPGSGSLNKHSKATSPLNSPKNKKNRTVADISSDDTDPETSSQRRKPEKPKTPAPIRKPGRPRKKPAAKQCIDAATTNAGTDGEDDMSI